MDSRDLSPVPSAPAASPAGYPDARSWAEAEIAEWLVEADEEASAIIDRARAEALRCELAGYEELERLREEAVKVRMATAERVARRLNEARFEADQLLAEAGTQAETRVDSARDVIRGVLGGLTDLQGQLPAGAGEQGAEAAAQLEGLLAGGGLAIPGRTGILDLTGAVLLDPARSSPRVSGSPDPGRDAVVLDDTNSPWPAPAPAAAARTATATASRATATAGAATLSTAVVPAPAPRTMVDMRPVPPPPTKVLALPERAGEGLSSFDDILPARPVRGMAAGWWDRLSRLVRRAA